MKMIPTGKVMKKGKPVDSFKAQAAFDETYARELVEKEAREAKEARRAELRARPHRIVQRTNNYDLDVDLHKYQNTKPTFDLEMLDHLLKMSKDEYMEHGNEYCADMKKIITEQKWARRWIQPPRRVKRRRHRPHVC